MTKVLAVEGMMCPHCKASVEKALRAVPGVNSAVADLDTKSATVFCAADVTDAALTAAVVEAGFEVKSVS